MTSNLPTATDPSKDRRFHRLHVERTLVGHPTAFATIAARMRAYQIYPPRTVSGIVCSTSGTIERGCTIVQRARLGPIRLETAVRVDDVIETVGPRSFSFEYVTLRGHPEQGRIRFRVSEEAEGVVRFAIDAWSRPGAWWARLARPAALVWQRRANHKAVANVTRPADEA